MELEPLKVRGEPLADRPVIGFTLELDGDHEEIGRVLGAVFREITAIQMDNFKRDDALIAVGRRWPRWPFGIGDLNVRGTLHYRKAI